MAGIGATLRVLIAEFEAATTAADKGRIYENIACSFLQCIPGVVVTDRRVVATAGHQEIDLGIVNRSPSLRFLPYILLGEAKGWQQPVGSPEISWFATKMRERSVTHGFLFAANGLTGDPDLLTAAHQQLSAALRDGQYVIVITNQNLARINRKENAITLIERRLTQLVVGRVDLDNP